MSVEKGHAPTEKELKRGPTVRLDGGARWRDRSWSPPGMAYNINFDSKGRAAVLKEHFDRYIDVDAAAYDGIVVKKGATNA